MKGFNLCWILASIFMLLGCDVKNKNNKDNQVSNINAASVESNLDSDGDGLLDKEEFGDNKYIAEFPYISIFDVEDARINTKFQNLSSGNYNDISVNYSGQLHINDLNQVNGAHGNIVLNKVVRKKIANLVYSSVFENNYDKDLFPTVEDAILGELGCLSSNEYYSKRLQIQSNYKHNEFSSHKVNFAYKYNFSSLRGVSEISLLKGGFLLKHSYLDEYSDFIDLKSYQPLFKFKNVSSLPYMKVFQNKISFVEDMNLSEMYNNKFCAYYKIEDFKYKKNNKELRFSQVISDVKAKNAHIFFSTNKESKWISLNASFYSIKSALKALGHNLIIKDNTNISEVDGLKNEHSENIHIEDLSDELLEKKRWYFLSTTGESLNQKLQEGEYYVVAYLSPKEMLENSSFSEKVFENATAENNLVIKNSYIGDEVEIIAKVEGLLKPHAEIVKYIEGVSREDNCDRRHDQKKSIACVFWSRHSNACVFTEYDNDTRIKKWLSLNPRSLNEKDVKAIMKYSNREITPTYISDSEVVYRFKLRSMDIVNNEVVFDFKDFQGAPLSYTRTVKLKNRNSSLRCKKEKTYSITKQTKRKLRFKIDIKREGIVR